MRWQGLFADLEAQFEEAGRAELAAEVADRTRREAARLTLADRLGPTRGHPVQVAVVGGAVVAGRLADVGVDWVLVEEQGAREVLVPLPAVLTVAGVGARSDAPDSAGEVARRLDLRWALRGLARSRTAVAVGLSNGGLATGTLDRVGADHVDLAEHGLGEARRAAAVRRVRLVPLRAVAFVRSG